MSKKFKNKLCVYCQKCPSIRQGDHVFARKFFTEQERNNLPKVPACEDCNTQKSKLEHYLTTVLPFGGMHQDAHIHLSTLVEPRLNNNLKLRDELCQGMSYRTSTDGNIDQTVLPFEGEKYLKLFIYIAKALSWYHWKTYIQTTTAIDSSALTVGGLKLYKEKFLSLRSKNKVQKVIGGHTVDYVGMQGTDNDQVSLWIFSLFNGATSSDTADDISHYSSCVGVVTGPARIIDRMTENNCKDNTTIK